MSYTYDQRKRPQGPQNASPEPESAPIPNYQALLNGTARPTAEQKGRPFDLDAAMKAKMENAFGDLSGVKFYESQAVGQAGAEAIAQGSEIAFAPGKADFSTRSGQERLGHELSHVMSQRSGQVRGSGFLNNASLEARADREGAMAAAGEQVYAGPVTHAISDASPSPFAAGAMQAKRRDADAKQVKQMQKEGESYNGMYATADYAGFDKLDPNQWETRTHTPGFSKIFGKKAQTYKVRNKSGLIMDQSKIDRSKDLTFSNVKGEIPEIPNRPGLDGLGERLEQKYGNPEKSKDFAYDETWASNVSRPANPVIQGVNDQEAPDTPVNIEGLGIARIFADMKSDRGRGFNMGAEEMEQFFDDLMAPKKKGLSDQEQLEANKRFDEAMKKYKKILYQDMTHTEKTYGRLMTQLHPEDVAPQMGTSTDFEKHIRFQQDAMQMVSKGGERYFDFENNEDDKHFKELSNYYDYAGQVQMLHNNLAYNPMYKSLDYVDSMESEASQKVEELEKNVAGPQMSPKLYKRYLRDVQNRSRTQANMRGKLFGRFKPERNFVPHPLKEDPILNDKPEEAPELLRTGEPEGIPDDPLNTGMIDYSPKKKKGKKKKRKGDLFDI